ncbi:hypothetical protein MKZ38_010210 [Zalerion maritima]|uniref:Uncharacterized protein n=1 Tax=Zalerion maritima TaxID=339359 RepID=A0AAD5RGN5_9PEZI|nr:hypothetical protein MKZ38_010210 [Zalerion maritima]
MTLTTISMAAIDGEGLGILFGLEKCLKTGALAGVPERALHLGMLYLDRATLAAHSSRKTTVRGVSEHEATRFALVSAAAGTLDYSWNGDAKSCVLARDSAESAIKMLLDSVMNLGTVDGWPVPARLVAPLFRGLPRPFRNMHCLVVAVLPPVPTPFRRHDVVLTSRNLKVLGISHGFGYADAFLFLGLEGAEDAG